MSLKPLSIWVLMVIALSTATFAQQYELSGLIGRTFISNQAIKGATFFNSDVRFGNGLTFEVDPAHRVYGGDFSAFPVTLEMPFVVNWDEDLNTGANVIPSHFRSFFLAPSARLNLAARSAFSPWVSFGGGFAHFSESSTLLYGGANPGPTGTNSGLLQAGAGFDLKIKGRYSLRTQVRDFWSGVPQLNVDTGKTRQHNLFVGSGIVAHF
jgi:hypothetical protein